MNRTALVMSAIVALAAATEQAASAQTSAPPAWLSLPLALRTPLRRDSNPGTAAFLPGWRSEVRPELQPANQSGGVCRRRDYPPGREVQWNGL